MKLYAFVLISVLPLAAQVTTHPAGQKIPHEKYIRVVSETDSPVEQAYIRAKDGVYLAAAIRKPKGPGPFPALVYFHGAPGGRGMEKLVSWSMGTTGGPLWERLLQEGYAVVVADYRNNTTPIDDAAPADRTTYVDDGVSVIDYVRALSYVDPNRIGIYGVSRGGNLAIFLATRAKVRATVLGAPAPLGFLLNGQQGLKNLDAPVLILVGTADSLLPYDRILYDSLERAGKKARMEIYENGYHDFVAGPQGHQGRDEPLLTSTLEALEITVEFLKQNLR
jgi:dipeptidyl aminopeptidase/acylaminoacyl peptidase